MPLPKPRGELSRVVLDWLSDETVPTAPPRSVWPESRDDEQLTLWVLYGLHETGFEGLRDAEWDPAVLTVRARLEAIFEKRLRSRYAMAGDELGRVTSTSVAEQIFEMVEAHEGPSIASHVHRRATVEQVRQLMRWRSLYHLREADPTTWVIPRLGVASKAAVVELQYDEYGGGDPSRLHSHLFARGLEASGLDPRRGAYVDQAPVEVLEMNNALTLFGLHRKWRAAALGHLAAFEATSSLPSRRMAQGLDRLGFPDELRHYYEEHVEADAVHEQLAARDICGSLVEEEPDLADDVLFGAWSCLDLEDRFAQFVLTEWGIQ